MLVFILMRMLRDPAMRALFKYILGMDMEIAFVMRSSEHFDFIFTLQAGYFEIIANIKRDDSPHLA